MDDGVAGFDELFSLAEGDDGLVLDEENPLGGGSFASSPRSLGWPARFPFRRNLLPFGFNITGLIPRVKSPADVPARSRSLSRWSVARSPARPWAY
jgi:hypothetical protein